MASAPRHRMLLLLALGAQTACGPAAGEGHTATLLQEQITWTQGSSLAGSYVLRWRARDAELIANRPATLDVEVVDSEGQPVVGAQVVARGGMPGHGHGMVREPLSRELGEGRYLVEGFLLHMSGHWELKFDVLRDGVAESVAFELELE